LKTKKIKFSLLRNCISTETEPFESHRTEDF